MLLIGFVWVIFATVISVVIKAFVPGRWEDHGPTIMVVAAAGSSLTSITGLLVLDGLNSAGPSNSAEATVGVVLSIVGGLIAVGLYVVDTRQRQKKALDRAQ